MQPPANGASVEVTRRHGFVVSDETKELMREFRKAGLRAQKKRRSKKLSRAERLEWGKKLRDSTRRDIAATMERLIEELRVATAAGLAAQRQQSRGA